MTFQDDELNMEIIEVKQCSDCKSREFEHNFRVAIEYSETEVFLQT